MKTPADHLVPKSTIQMAVDHVNTTYQAALTEAHNDAIDAIMVRRLGNLFLGTSRHEAEVIVADAEACFDRRGIHDYHGSNLMFSYGTWRCMAKGILETARRWTSLCEAASGDNVSMSWADKELVIKQLGLKTL
jgi:hypothetical protein